MLVLFAGCARDPDLTLTLQWHSAATTPSASDLAAARDTVRRRLAQSAVSPAEVEVAGNDRIVVRIAREDDSTRLRSLLTTSGLLELRLIRQPAAGSLPTSPQELLAELGGQLPPDLEILAQQVHGKSGEVTATQYFAVERQPLLTGLDIQSARPGRGQSGGAIVEFQVKAEPARTFAEATGANVGSLLAIVIDGRVVSAPRINSRIGADGMIEGDFTSEQAEDLAILLRAGPVPGRLTLLEERVETGH